MTSLSDRKMPDLAEMLNAERPDLSIHAGDVISGDAGAGCVKAVLCGHWHRNNLSHMGGIPVLVRISNVETPFGYSMVHCYPDGRLVVVQKSQHFPAEEFISAGFAQGKQGAASDRYLTIGGTSRLPLTGLRVMGDAPVATIVDGHLRVSSREGRAIVLVDTGALDNARLTLTAIKSRAERMGALALASPDGSEGVESAVTSQYSPDGKVMIVSRTAGQRQVLSRSWFNVADDIFGHRYTREQNVASFVLLGPTSSFVMTGGKLLSMSKRKKARLGALGVTGIAFLVVATRQASAVESKARGLRAGMSLGEVMQQLDGWLMINTHPMDSRAIPHGTGPEFNGYRGEMYVLTPVRPNGRETDLRKISRAEFMARLERLLGNGKPWTVYFSYRTMPTHRGILVQFDGHGRTALVSDR